MSRSSRGVLTALLVAVGVVLSGCGEKVDDLAARPPALTLTVITDGPPSPVQAGLYAAQANGDFARVGLTVRLVADTGPEAALASLQAGRGDFALSSEPELLRSRDRGTQLAAVATIARGSRRAVVSERRGPTFTPAALASARIGVDGSAVDKTLLEAVARNAGLEPSTLTQVDIGTSVVPALRNRRVAAALADADDPRVQKAGVRALPVTRSGVPVYDDTVLVARPDDLRKRGPEIRRFIQALQEGTRALRDDPALGVGALAQADPGLDRAALRTGVADVLPALLPSAP